MLFRQRQSFTVPVTSGQYAPELITLSEGAQGLGTAWDKALVAIESGGPAGAVAELWLGEIGLDPTNTANYINSGISITIGSTSVSLAGWPTVQIRVKSGGTAGSALVGASAVGYP